MSKKLISLLLTICMLFCLSACGTTETSNNSTDTPSESQTDTTQDTDENTSNKENSQVSSNTVETNENDTTQTQPSTNQSKPTSTTNQPTHTHSYSNATCTSPKKCSCGATAGTALGHQFSSATCTSPQICSRCGTTSEKALGHNYSAANCNSPKTCTRCGQKEGSDLGHNYVNNKCSRCGKVDPDSMALLYDMDIFDAQEYAEKKQNCYDTYGNSYDKLILFGDSSGYYSSPDPSITYRLAGKYTKFEATIGYYDSNKSGYDNYWMEGNLTIKIYKDSEIIYMKNNITKWSEPTTISLDIAGCNFLKIEVIGNIHENGYIILGNAIVKK